MVEYLIALFGNHLFEHRVVLHAFSRNNSYKIGTEVFYTRVNFFGVRERAISYSNPKRLPVYIS